MKKWLFASAVGATILLSGCAGTGDVPSSAPLTNSDTTTSEPAPTSDGDVQAGGSIDCSAITKEDAATFAIWAQLFAQVRAPEAMTGMTAMGYDAAKMAAILDTLDGLKGTSGEVYGKPDDALVVFRTANDTYAAIIAKGDAATAADFAPLDDLEPDVQSWITAQATVLDALTQACPDL